MKRSTLVAGLLLVGSLSTIAAAQPSPPGQPLWQQAKILLDDHFGDDATLIAAAKLLARAKEERPLDANVYVQAARLVIKGGQIAGTTFRPGSVQAYGDLLDQALALDRDNLKAIVLRAEAYGLQGDFAKQRAALDRAKALNPTDPWLWIGFARYCTSLQDNPGAYDSYLQVLKLGPGNSAEQRNAYVQALVDLTSFRVPGEQLRLPELASLARSSMSRRDHGTPATLSRRFAFHGMYPEAVDYARESIRIKSTQEARLSLAAGLYGHAALLAETHQPLKSQGLANEAAALGFTKSAILQRLSGPSANFNRLLPRLDQMIS